MWPEFVVLSRQTTIDELVKSVQARQAYYAVIRLPEGQYTVASVYGEHGLRDRLTQVADVIGRDILDLKLEQFPDLWLPCPAIAVTTRQDEVIRASEQSQGRIVVVDNSQIVGVFETKHVYPYPYLPTVLFGKTYDFQRETRPADSDLARRCEACQTTFAYYKPILENGILTDYACPHCGITLMALVEIRMRPGGISKAGFLGNSERLEDVIAQDNEMLKQLGVTHEEAADALDHLLDAAMTAYKDEIAEAARRLARGKIDTLIPIDVSDDGKKLYVSEGVVPLPMSHSLAEIEAQVEQGDLPPEGTGACIGDYQVFLQVYAGYQYCPWTFLHQLWSFDNPSPLLMTIEQKEEDVWSINVVNGLTLPCRYNLTYRYADLDFLIINRRTKKILKGPGLIVHLIRDHHFFEGRQSRYRIDPKQMWKFW